jgi:stringent starvation protein B
VTSKLQTALCLLQRTPTIYLHIDARATDLALPAHLIGKPQVLLQIGRNMPVPIPDLQITENGVSATLSFKGKPFRCAVPWGAVKALVGDDGKGAVFDTAWAKEVTAGVGAIAPAAPAHPSERPYLRRVK